MKCTITNLRNHIHKKYKTDNKVDVILLIHPIDYLYFIKELKFTPLGNVIIIDQHAINIIRTCDVYKGKWYTVKV